MAFGPPAKTPYKRWKKALPEIMSTNRFNPDNFMTTQEIEDWITERRHKVMFKDAAKVE